jgi:hypothetical protein
MQEEAGPVHEVVLALDERGVRMLVDFLTAMRRHLDRGVLLPDYELMDLRDRRIPFVMWEIRDQLGLQQMYGMGPPNPYAGAMTGPIAATLRLDAATARALESALYDLGEHYAAGAPVGRASAEAEVRLNAFLAELTAQRGSSAG